jgi:kinesin family protein 20
MPAHIQENSQAFLRIRPDLVQGESSRVPYLTQLTDTTVRMVDPNKEAPTGAARFRPSSIPPASMYTFSHIFPPTTTQSEFFTNTTLPLVQDILQGQNGLLFTYGVTNSGKTYTGALPRSIVRSQRLDSLTVQGGNTHGSAGIVPRTLDVIFNSIAGLEGDGKV